jgi:predicted nucleic-acid-binding protein
MLPNKVYIDSCILFRWFLWKFYQRKYKKEPKIIRYLNENASKTKSYVSILTIAELVKILKHDERFKNKDLNIEYIEKLIEELQNIAKFDIINTIRLNGFSIDGVILSKNIVKYVELHPDLIDCIHVDIAKTYELWFLTDEKKIGKLKVLYNSVMTENKFFKQDFD